MLKLESVNSTYLSESHKLEVEKTRTTIVNLLNSCEHLSKGGQEHLLNKLDACGFFYVPGSIKYHNKGTGGLAKHCLNVYYHLAKLNSSYKTGLSKTAMFFIAFGHDLCKTQFYTIKDSKWGYVKDAPKGHALLSLKILKEWGWDFKESTPIVYLSIKYHMGAYEKLEYNWSELSKAQEITSVFLTHLADMMDTKNVNVKTDNYPNEDTIEALMIKEEGKN